MAQQPRPSGRLPQPEKRTRADYQGSTVAPYTRFRPEREFYTFIEGGTYTADIWGCPWRCDRCWSHFGQAHGPVVYECTPQLVVDKFLAGMTRNAMAGSRISGGDVGYWWEHTRQVVDEFLNRTRGKRLKISRRRTKAMLLLLETSGGIRITPEQLTDIEQMHGEHAANLVLSIGMKATNPELLGKLTGLPPAAARAAHERQLKLVRAAMALEHVEVLVSFLGPYTVEEEYEQIRSDLMEIRAEAQDTVTVLRFRNYNRNQ